MQRAYDSITAMTVIHYDRARSVSDSCQLAVDCVNDIGVVSAQSDKVARCATEDWVEEVIIKCTRTVI